jgi:hypothetical protein
MFALSRSSAVVVGGHNIFREGGVAMATLRSIVEQIPVSFECQEKGDRFNPPKDRKWPVASRNGRYLAVRPAVQIPEFNTGTSAGRRQCANPTPSGQ